MSTFKYAPAYGVTCDGCGETLDQYYLIDPFTPEDARTCADGAEWSFVDGRDYCDGCSQCATCSHWPYCHDPDGCSCWAKKKAAPCDQWSVGADR